ncbi:hypothetical protein ACVINZ_005823 [Mesorhizobium jarvisii]
MCLARLLSAPASATGEQTTYQSQRCGQPPTARREYRVALIGDADYVPQESIAFGD